MSLRAEAIRGAIWTYGQQFGTQFISFIVSVFLARILLPEEFGLIGMITILMGIGTTLFDGGMTSSLIRSESLEDSDYSTVFIFNFAVSISVYILMIISAPLIANFYHQPTLTSIIRVYGLSFVFSAFGSVQNTILTKELNFKKQAILNIPSIIFGGVVAILMANLDFGVWSLVAMTLCNTFLLSLLLWLSSPWKPKLIFTYEKFKKHFNYGYKLTISGILDIVFTNIYQIIIGRFFSAKLVGYYTRANQLMMMPVGNVSTALNKVAFPLFAKMQDDIHRLKNAYKKIMLIVLYVVNPIIVLMVILAKPLIVFLFTEKWIEIVPIFQIVCLSGVLYPLHLYNLLILQVKGRSDLFLKLEIIKKILMIIILVITFYFGFYGLLWGQLVFSIIALFINTFFAGRILNYPFWRQIIDIVPLFILAGLMGIFIYFFDSYLLQNYSNIIRLVGNTIFGFFFYIGFSYIFKFETLFEIRKIIIRK